MCLADVNNLFAEALWRENNRVSSSCPAYTYRDLEDSFNGDGIEVSYVDALPDLGGSTEIANGVNGTAGNAGGNARAADCVADSARVTALERAKTNFVSLVGWNSRNQRKGCSCNNGKKCRLHFD